MLQPPVRYFNVPYEDDGYRRERRMPQSVVDFRNTVQNIDWTRLHIQAVGMHSRMHNGNDETTCGLCIRECLLNPVEGR